MTRFAYEGHLDVVEASITIPGDVVVPANELWILRSILWRYTSTATAGARDPAVLVRNAADDETLAQIEPANAIGAGSTGYFLFAVGMGRETALDGVYRQQGLGELGVRAGEILRFTDAAGVDSADAGLIRVTMVRRRIARV